LDRIWIFGVVVVVERQTKAENVSVLVAAVGVGRMRLLARRKMNGWEVSREWVVDIDCYCTRNRFLFLFLCLRCPSQTRIGYCFDARKCFDCRDCSKGCRRRGFEAIAARRMRLVGLRGRVVVSLMEKRRSLKGRGFAAHMYCPCFFCARRRENLFRVKAVGGGRYAGLMQS
jgi:hypothetical protein